MGVCDRGGVQVSRAQPAILSGLVTDEQWNSFCERCDAALKPIEVVKNVNLAFLLISAILLLVMLIGGLVLLADASNFYKNNSDERFWIFMLTTAGFIVIGGIAVTVWGKKKAFEVRAALRRVCDDVSAEHPHVSFHVKFEAFTLFRGREANTMVLNYIEVNIKDPEGGGGAGPQVVVNINTPGATTEVEDAQTEEAATTAVPVVKGMVIPEQAVDNEEDCGNDNAEESRTAAERLAQLEGLKGILTEEEYNEKRKEILATV